MKTLVLWCSVHCWIPPPWERCPRDDQPHKTKRGKWGRKRTNALSAEAPPAPVLLHHFLFKALTGGGAFSTDPPRMSEETLNIILLILTDALDIHTAFVCIGTLLRHTHTHTHSVRQTHNKPTDPLMAERGMDRIIPVILFKAYLSSAGLKSVCNTAKTFF